MPEPKPIAENIYQVVRCPECNAEMAKRTGRFGDFYSCVNYFQGCKGTRTVKNVEIYGNGVDFLRKDVPEEEPPPVVDVINADIPTEDKDIKLIPTEKYPYLKFKYKEFNPVQSRVFEIYSEDINCVIAAATSVGKTAMGEMFMADAINKGKKALFLSPLKAVSQEKYDDWSDIEHGFCKKGTSIVTGDYQISASRIEELNKAGTVILTTEMLDSRSRNILSEKNDWLLNADVCVVDECFLGGTKIMIENNFSLSIEEIYNNENITHVMSYNETTKTLEKKKILRKIRNIKSGGLLSVKYDVDGRVDNLVCTPNHKIWTKNGYKRADELVLENSFFPQDIIKIFYENESLKCCCCNQEFNTRLKLVNHYLAKHFRKKTFECDKCKRVFLRKCDLKFHENNIHIKKEFKCEFCDYVAMRTSMLSMHLKKSHGVIYKSKEQTVKCESKCDICNAFFVDDNMLKNHLKSIHKIKYLNRQLFCNECNIQFESKAKYESHLKWKHDAEYVKKYYDGREKIDYDSLNKKRLKTMEENGALLKFSDRMKKNNPMKNQSSIDKMKITNRDIWNNKSEEEKNKIRENWRKAPLRGRGTENLEPTSLEKKVIDLNMTEIAYTGNGKFWLTIGKRENGRKWGKNPDFKVRGQRKVIEVGDIEYWHTMEEIEKVVKAYESIDYKCLYLTNRDFKNDYEGTINRITTFVRNHDGVVTSVKGFGAWSTEKEYVYNLEVEDNHNYIANNVLVSNCHLITVKGRGDKLESALMRFTKQNPSCRIVFLSATMPNVKELADWLTKLNGKKTKLINSSYRPCKLTTHYETYLDRGGYADQRKNKIDKAIDLVKRYPTEKFILFVHDKSTGKILLDTLLKDGITSEFHSADLKLKDRVRIEQEFKSREASSLRVIVATSTLAWGCNLPARRVVILGIHRGMNEVEPLDISQMKGRAGRVGLDPEGDAYILLPRNKKDYYIRWCEQIPPITSTFNDPDILAFHIVSEMVSKEVYDIPTLVSWYNRSFAAFKGNMLDLVAAKRLFDRLEKFCAVEKDGEKYIISMLGRIASSLYFSPYSISGWCFNFNKIFEKELHNDDRAVSWALANVFENSSSFVPKELTESVRGYVTWCESNGLKINDKCAVTGLSYLACLRNDYFDIGKKTQVKFDFDRTTSALKAIDERFAQWKKGEFFDLLYARVKYEVNREQAVLCSMKGVGGAYARKLYEAGIRNASDFKTKRKNAISALGDKTYSRIYDENFGGKNG